MPPQNTLRQLGLLDGSSPEFHDQLTDILDGEEYARCVMDIQGGDLARLVDYLDEALDTLHPTSPVFHRCLRELKHVCGIRAPIALTSSGDLYEGRTLEGSKVRINRVRVCSQEGPTLYQTAVAWKRLEHQSIVPLLGVTSSPLQFISEWMPGGDLTGYISKYPGADRISLLYDIAEGLRFLHSHNMVHGDLKGPNILVDAAGHARITDAGLALVTQDLGFIWSDLDDRGYTARWTAPEILNEQGTYSKEADIFSFAMVMIEAFTGAVPFGNISPVMAVLAIREGKRPPRPTHPAFTEGLWALMQRCWAHDSCLRPDAAEVLQILLAPDPPVWKRLIGCSLSKDERITLISSIFTNNDETKVVGHLSGDDAQTFVDVVDEVLDSLAPEIHRKSVRCLRRICGDQAILPRSLVVPLCYNPTELPQCRGGFADVWKGQHGGKEVAAKVLRIYLTDDLERVRKRFCKEVMTWRTLRHPNVLPLLGVMMTERQFVMVSGWMANGSIDAFVKTRLDANRFELLVDAIQGLAYMHNQGIIHGDLKGANIMIDDNGRACISDFSLLAIIYDQQTFISSYEEGGTAPWMGPELLDPGSFGLKDSRPTKESDRYALGMVVYEVLSGQVPFSAYRDCAIVLAILRGERPERPQGTQGSWFTDGIWKMLELYWRPQPGDRPSLDAMLRCLQDATRPLELSSGVDPGDQLDATSNESGLAIMRGGNELSVPLQNFPRTVITSSDLSSAHGETGLTISSHTYPPGTTNPAVPPQKGSSQSGWVERFARSARRMFEAIIRKLSGF